MRRFPTYSTHSTRTAKLAAVIALALAALLALACSPPPAAEPTPAPPAADTPTPAPPTATPEPSTATPAPPTATPEPTPTAPPPTATAPPGPTPRIIRRPSQEEGEIAPDFEVTTFDGETLRLSDLVGKVVVLNFWASWCPPCRWEMPFFERMSQEYADQGVIFVGLAMSDTLEDAAGFAESVGVTYPLALGDNEVVIDYGVRSLPTTFFIDKGGRIQRRLTSPANEGLLKVFIRGQLRAP